jgi:hypothetical protein
MTASRKALIVVGVLVGVALGLPWAGAGPTATAPSISVTAANPPSGEQGTLSLDVVVGGKGFKNGATAKFLRHDTGGPGGINVKSTRFVNSTQLVASIEIAGDATPETITKFDIQVARTRTAARARALSSSAWSRKAMGTSARLRCFQLPSGWTTTPAT